MHKEIALFIPQSGSRRMFSMAEQRSLAAMQSRRESDLEIIGAKVHANPRSYHASSYFIRSQATSTPQKCEQWAAPQGRNLEHPLKNTYRKNSLEELLLDNPSYCRSNGLMAMMKSTPRP